MARSTFQVSEADTATLTIKNTDRDTSGDTVRFYVGSPPFSPSDEVGSASGVSALSDLDISYSVPDPGTYRAELVIDRSGGDREAWVQFRLCVTSWASIPTP